MASRNIKWCKCCGKQLGGCLNKLNIELVNIWPSNSRPGHKCKRNENRYLYPNVHSSTSHNSQKWKQLNCLSTDEWTNQMWYTHIMEYYSDVKRKEVVIHVTMWMSLKSMMLSDRRQAQKTTECMVPFIWNVQDRKIRGDRKQSSYQRLKEEGLAGGVTANWSGLPVYRVMRMFWN